MLHGGPTRTLRGVPTEADDDARGRNPGARAVSAAVRGRSVVITGAAGGLGRTLTATLERSGARLLLVDCDAAALLALAPRPGTDVLVADIATPAGRRSIVARCAELGIPPDILVNNAGIERASEYTALSAAEVGHALEVNLLGAMLLTHELLPAMRERRRGHVVTIASLAGLKPIPYNAVYNTAKAGLVAFSLSLSKELAGSGVSATVICPAAVRDAGMWARVSAQLPRNRLVEGATIRARDVADAVVRAVERRPVRILVGSPMVRGGALLSAAFPAVDAATDRVSRLRAVYRRRIETDRANRL